jgi:hypothetical protein
MIALISQLVTNLKDKPSAGSAPPATQGRVVVPVVPVPGDSVDEFWVLTGLRWGHQGVCVCARGVVPENHRNFWDPKFWTEI